MKRTGEERVRRLIKSRSGGAETSITWAEGNMEADINAGGAGFNKHTSKQF